jgi:phosphate ABC transporter phosphate-binding protein
MSRVGTWARLTMAAGLAVLMGVALGGAAPATAQQSYQRISGEGSSWSANFIDAMRVNVAQFGMTIDYNPSGSTSGRKNYLNGTVDFAASDIPFQFHPEDGSAPENPAPGSYVYVPVTAGGTAFMYNLKINGQQVTNLRLSGENVAKIFTGVITMWNDPAIQADNPGLVMPARQVVPVVRSDGSGSSAQFTMWMINRHPQIWTDYCARVGRQNACGFTSFYPTFGSPMQAQQGDLGVAGYVSQGFAEGAIGYVNYSYALGVQFPVAKVLNAAGYYTEPTPENVAVSLLQADINRDESNPAVYLTQQLEGVYTNPDPRNYELSSYSYFILPTRVAGQFNEAKGYTLSEFAKYAMCQGQQQSASLGYSPMPINLVQASFEQIAKIPGAVAENINIQNCNNPTFSPSGENLLAANAAMPPACDQAGQLQCPNGTGGMRNVPTAVTSPPPDGTQQPPAGGQQPGTGQQPSTGGQPPATGAQQPSTGGQQPSTGGQDPATGAQDPGAGAQDPGTGGQPTSPGGQQPSTGGQQPSAGQTGGTTATTAPCATTTTTTVPNAPTGTDPATTTSTTSTSTTTTSTPAPTGATPSTTTLPPCSPTTTLAPGVVAAQVDSAPVLQAGCDPDTGVCTGGVVDPLAGGEVTAAALGPVVGAVTPVTLEQRSRWGSSQTLIVLVSVLTLGAILGPAAAWRYFGARKAAPA